MLGGRIRGQGTYGCVFQPALKCRGKKVKTLDDTMVGKITSAQDAKNELETSKILHNDPLYKDYTIPVELTTCTPRSIAKQSEEDIDKCNLLNDIDLEDTVQLLMPWGGYPLSRINLDPYVFNYVKFMENILACGSFLLLNEICHFDIWGNNFLFDKQNKPRVIDFGFSFKASELKTDDLPVRWRVVGFDHDTETPEVTLMLGVHSEMHVTDMIRSLEKEKPAVQRLAAFCDVNPVHWSGELYQWTLESKSFQKHDWLSCWKVYWPGFDAWSIGAVLLEVLEVQMGIPAFVESNAWKTKGDLIKKILIGLTRSHPAYRIDSAEALNLLTEGNHVLISSGSAGSEWILEKAKSRPPEI